MTKKHHDDDPKPPSRSEGYLVGYGKTPVGTRFPKGRSGNPKGRAKGGKQSKSLAQEINDFAAGRVSAREGDKVRNISKREALFLSLFKQAMNGNVTAARKVWDLIEEAEMAESDVNPQTELTSEDRAILKRYLERTEELTDGSEST